MKVLVLITCTLVVASAEWSTFPKKYNGPQHVPIIHNGVPVDTPEVQHARAAHFAALSEAYSHSDSHAHSGYYQANDESFKQDQNLENKYEHESLEHDHTVNQYEDQNFEHEHHVGNQYENQDYGYIIEHQSQPSYDHHHIGSNHLSHSMNELPAIGHDGTPLDTLEVETAKAKHFAAVQEALSRNVKLSHGSHYRKRRSANSYIHYSTPTETYGHEAEHAPGHSFQQSPVEIYLHSHEHLPQAPVDTYEVQKARTEHILAHAAVAHSNSHSYAIHQEHYPVYGYHHTHEDPRIGHDGKPLDTAEVQHAKAVHYAAYQEALLRNSHQHHVVTNQLKGPMDTPEVQHAKLLHFAAHAAAKAHNY